MEKSRKETVKIKLMQIKERIGMDKVFLILLAGVLLMLSSFPFSGTEKGTADSQTESAASGEAETGREEGQTVSSSGYAAGLEQRLEEVLLAVEGVGEVKVMITLKDSGQKELQADTVREQSATSETDSSGGSRSIQENREESSTVILSGGSSDSPYITRETAPEIEGVLVVAQGGGNAAVKAEIYEAVQALFSVPAHKIKVLKGVLEN